MQKKRGRIMTVLSVLLLAGLLLGAFYVPGLINSFYDKRTMGQINTKKLEFDLYEPAYASFEEKLHVIGMAVEDGAVLELIEITKEQSEYDMGTWKMGELTEILTEESESSMEYGELTEESVRREIELLIKEGLKIELDMDQFCLKSSKLYTVFGSGKDSGNVLSGIQVYELLYIPEEMIKSGLVAADSGYYAGLVLYVDAQFHKIYAFMMQETMGFTDFDYGYIEESGTQVLLDYWGIGEKYPVDSLTEEYGDRWKADGNWCGLSYENLFFGENAQLALWKEVYSYKPEKIIRIGMHPFNDVFYSIYSELNLG